MITALYLSGMYPLWFCLIVGAVLDVVLIDAILPSDD